jgi:NADH-quinone oxidoreductase subunit N
MQNMLLAFLPEEILIGTIIVGQILDIFKICRAKIITLLSFFAILIAYLASFYILEHYPQEIIEAHKYFNLNCLGQGCIQRFYFAKQIIFLLLSILTLICYGYYYIGSQKIKFEYISIILLAGLGALVGNIANDFLTLFLAMELQMIASYLLVGFNRSNLNATSASVKYFILGTVTSCVMLFGISLIYGFAGSINYEAVRALFDTQVALEPAAAGLVLGVALVVLSCLFKLGAAPMHFWLPDVYQGGNILTLLFFTLVSKIGTIAVLINLIFVVTDSHVLIKNIILTFALISLYVGAIGGLKQFNINRLLAYSSIMNMGFVLLLLSLPCSIRLALDYLLIYVLSTTCFVIMVLSINRKNIEAVTFENIAALGLKHKYSGLILTILIMSMIGMPPFAGFIVKYKMLWLLFAQREHFLAGSALFATAVSAFYYLKIIRALYFKDKPHLHGRFYIPFSHMILVGGMIIFIMFYGMLCYNI